MKSLVVMTGRIGSRSHGFGPRSFYRFLSGSHGSPWTSRVGFQWNSEMKTVSPCHKKSLSSTTISSGSTPNPVSTSRTWSFGTGTGVPRSRRLSTLRTRHRCTEGGRSKFLTVFVGTPGLSLQCPYLVGVSRGWSRYWSPWHPGFDGVSQEWSCYGSSRHPSPGGDSEIWTSRW